MQLVLSNNRVIAHGENFLSVGGVVINTETGARFENATVAECNGCPSDIDKVGYEYHAGEFVPCAPFSKGNNNGYFMEVCENCAVPRSSGIPIKNGLKLVNLDKNDVTAHALGGMSATLLWENASPTSTFEAQPIDLGGEMFDIYICVTSHGTAVLSGSGSINHSTSSGGSHRHSFRNYAIEKVSGEVSIQFYTCLYTRLNSQGLITTGSENSFIVPQKIYGVKL
jgi:hypothetical protein